MPKLLTIPEACEQLSVSRHTIYKWVSANRIPHVKLPNKQVRFDAAAIEKWIKTRTVNVIS